MLREGVATLPFPNDTPLFLPTFVPTPLLLLFNIPRLLVMVPERLLPIRAPPNELPDLD